jgi:hypothetical protein
VANSITIVEVDAERGQLVGATVQPCSRLGIIVVTLLYGDAELDHDVEVYLGQSYISREVNDNRTTFVVGNDALYDVQAHSPSKEWTVQLGYKYRGRGKPNHHTSIQIPLVPRPDLTMTCIDHHFAPGPETLNAYYTTKNLETDTVRLTVSGTNYHNDIVYQVDDVDSTDGRHNMAWQGTANQGPLNGTLINPLHSPYTIQVEADTAGLIAEAQFHVLYHSVTLAKGTYIADPTTPPDETANRAEWVQYKLNELGYFAGPVDGNVGNQTIRAMNRYVFQHPDLRKPLGGIDEDFVNDDEDSDAFRTALRGNQQPWTIITNNQLPDHGDTARLYIDHNYFYRDPKDFSKATGHVDEEAAMLDRFELPIEATIRLIGKAGGEVVSPKAVGEVSVEWAVDEVPEDTSSLPDGTDRNTPSRTRQYVDAALAATKDDAGLNNCPTTLGGARRANNPNQGYFRIGNDLPPFTSTAVGNDVVEVTTHQGGNNKRGKAGILFLGSYIAGDNYRITAKISFRDRPNKDALEAAHSQAMNGQAWEDILLARTGRMTIWRKHNIAAVINWPAPATAIDWDRVAAEYENAYCELEHANKITLSAAQLRARRWNNDPHALTFEAHMAYIIGGDRYTKGIRTDRNPMNVVWDNASLFHTNYEKPAQNDNEDGTKYLKRVNSDVDATISTKLLQSFAKEIPSFLNKAGGVIIHGRWIPAIQVNHRARFTGRTYQETHEIDLHCIGLRHGVIVLSHSMYPDYQDRFLVPHEMGHTRFLNHHETKNSAQPHNNPINPYTDTPAHHDLRDHNCTMCYPFGIHSRNNRRFRRNLSWAPDSPRHSAFCGKCLLKLRGWNITDNPMPEASPQ